MSKSDLLEQQWLDLYFNGTPIPGIAENDTTGPVATFSIALHTADPGETGTQLTFQATYTGYTQVQVARAVAAWLRSGSTINPVVSITFPAATSGPETFTHWSIGPGGNVLHWSGIINPNIVLPAGGGGISPTLRGNDAPPASTVTED